MLKQGSSILRPFQLGTLFKMTLRKWLVLFFCPLLPIAYIELGYFAKDLAHAFPPCRSTFIGSMEGTM